MIKETYTNNEKRFYIVTTETIPGKRILDLVGLVHSSSVQAKNIFHDIGTELKSIVGGKLSKYEAMIETAKNSALQSMHEQAVQRGANAIIAFRFATTNTTAAGSAEIVAYGTAVIVE